MKTIGTKSVAVIVILSLMISCMLSFAALADGGASGETVVTKKWDFSSTNQGNDFTFYKRNSGDTAGSVSENVLLLGAESGTGNKRAVLKESLNVRSISVDITPTSGSTTMDAGIILGDDGGTAGSIYASKCVLFSLSDSNPEGDRVCLKVTAYNGDNTSTEILPVNTSGYYVAPGSNNPIAMRMRLDIAGKYVLVTVSKLSDETGGYLMQKVIDITKKYSDSTVSGLTEETLSGHIGVYADTNGRGASFDNLSLDVNIAEQRNWDFSSTNQGNDFAFYKRNSGDTAGSVSENVLLLGAESGTGNKRAVLKESLNARSISVDIIPTSGSTTMDAGIILGDDGGTAGSIYASKCVLFSLSDSNPEGDRVCLKVTAYNGDNTSTEILPVNTSGYYVAPGSNNPIAMRMRLDIAGKYVLVTVSKLSDETGGYLMQTVIDITKIYSDSTASGLTEETLSGHIGVYADTNGKGASFDNLTLDVDCLNVGGFEQSKVPVYTGSALPTGETVVDNKYIMGWTLDGEQIDTYSAATGIYKADVIDKKMLEVKSQQGDSESLDTDTYNYTDVRFVASLNEFYNSETESFEKYANAGFVFSLTESNPELNKTGCFYRTTKNLYTAMMADGESKTVSEIYESDYPQYFFAFEMTGVPVDVLSGTRTIYARAYVELEDSTIIYGDVKTVVVTTTTTEQEEQR